MNEPASSVSIVVPCRGQLEHTRLCVPSLLRHSRGTYELIFVDIGSLDGTPDYLAGVADAAPVRVDVVRAVADTDFSTAVATALERARGDFVVWLNNDTVVTSDWLQQLVALCGSHERMGMVGPMSNYAPTLQRVAQVPYRIGARTRGQGADSIGERNQRDIETVDRFAREWREQHQGQWFEAERLGGFCLLMRRALLQKVGFFDDQSEKGLFDADALCLRMRRAGYHLACCGDLFIHNFGTRLAAT
jgi:GT2 family glycosyltransferase